MSASFLCSCICEAEVIICLLHRKLMNKVLRMVLVHSKYYMFLDVKVSL